MRHFAARAEVGVVVLALSSGLLGIACMRPADMWVVPGSTAARLTFGVAQERGGKTPIWGLALVMVEACYDPDRRRDVFWKAEGPELTRGATPTRIRYGVAPPGFANESGPRPLTSGCYEAHISGTGVSAAVRFAVDTAGAVREDGVDVATLITGATYSNGERAAHREFDTDAPQN